MISTWTKPKGIELSNFKMKDKEVLAKYYIHPDLNFRGRFNMTIYSNKYPEEIYFLGLSAHATVLLLGKSSY